MYSPSLKEATLLINSLLTEEDNIDIPKIILPLLPASDFTEHTYLCRHEYSQDIDEYFYLRVIIFVSL